MFDFLRVAGLATLALGAAGASGQAVTATSATGFEKLPAVAPTTTLPPTPAALPFIELPVKVHRLEMALPPQSAEPEMQITAASLSELVRRHASPETISRSHHCLAGAVYFEAKGEPLDGQLAVAKVILNRADSGRFAQSVCGVVHQRGQFSFVRNGTMPSVARSSANWRTAVAIAHIATNNLWAPTAPDALYFHARRVSPSWRMTRLATIGNHVFYR
jgi:N-acetylmuramoyl-L-alanine amidase